VPPAIADSWRETAKEKFRLDNCDIITNGSLHKITRPEKYDLVIVDEAHKFRNDTAEAFDELQRICKSPTQHFLPDGSRASKRVILVSATPLNNRPDDIRNLISLFQDLKDSTLSVANLQHFFARCQKEYQEAHKLRDAEQARQRVKTIYERIRTKVIWSMRITRKTWSSRPSFFPRLNRRAKFSMSFRQHWRTFTTAPSGCSRLINRASLPNSPTIAFVPSDF
jgi:hypothetical protein